MPIYDYHCDHCGHSFSSVQSFNDPPFEKCPSCGRRPRRLFTAPAIVFKGSGWYKTDSRPAPKSETGGGTETKSEGKKESKSEERPGAKSEKSAPKGEAAS